MLSHFVFLLGQHVLHIDFIDDLFPFFLDVFLNVCCGCLGDAGTGMETEPVDGMSSATTVCGQHSAQQTASGQTDSADNAIPLPGQEKLLLSMSLSLNEETL